MANWFPISKLRKINKSIAGYAYPCKNGKIPKGGRGASGKFKENQGKSYEMEYTSYILDEPIYVRNNNGKIEYSLDVCQEELIDTFLEYKKYEVPNEIYQTTIGEIDLYDEGEFGGHLEINKKFIINGNFSHIFMFKNRKFVLDSRQHMACKNFRIIEIFDNGEIEILYDADKLGELHKKYYEEICDSYEENFKNEKRDSRLEIKHQLWKNFKEEYKLNLQYEVGFDIMKKNENKLLFFCEGSIFDLDKRGVERSKEIYYILEYDGENFMEYPIEIKDYISGVNSLEYDEENKIFYIGCDKEIIICNAKTKKCEIYTNLDVNREELLIER